MPCGSWLTTCTTRDSPLLRYALFTSWSACLAVVPLYASSTYGCSPSDLGVLYSVASIAAVVGAPAGGLAADRLGRGTAVALGGATVATSFAAMALTHDYAQLLGAMALVGLGEGIDVGAYSQTELRQIPSAKQSESTTHD